MDHPGAWLHRVAINLAHSHYRRRQAARRARRRVEAHAGVPALLPDSADAVAALEALGRLPERHRPGPEPPLLDRLHSRGHLRRALPRPHPRDSRATPPIDAEERDPWAKTAFAIEQYLLRWDITDPHHTLGDQPTDPLQRADYLQTALTVTRHHREIEQTREIDQHLKIDEPELGLNIGLSR